MPSRSHVLTICAVISWLCIVSPATPAEQTIASAVDAAGKRHLASRVYPGLDEPWMRDRTAVPPPEYPVADRRGYHQGDGLFRAFIDTRTGGVTEVHVLKSTGFPSLDRSAVAAVRRSRWKPGTWRQADVPVRFKIAGR